MIIKCKRCSKRLGDIAQDLMSLVGVDVLCEVCAKVEDEEEAKVTELLNRSFKQLLDHFRTCIGAEIGFELGANKNPLISSSTVEKALRRKWASVNKCQRCGGSGHERHPWDQQASTCSKCGGTGKAQ